MKKLNWKQRKTREGWRSYAFKAPPEAVAAVKEFYKEWKQNNLHLWIKGRERNVEPESERYPTV